MNSDQFDPKNTLSFELIEDVFATPSKETFDTIQKTVQTNLSQIQIKIK